MTVRRVFLLSTVCTVFAPAGRAAAARAAPRYAVTDIGALIDPTGLAVPSRATGIDAAGRVVGTGWKGAPGDGFLYEGGRVRRLSLGYPHTVPGKMSVGGVVAAAGLESSSDVIEAARFDGTRGRPLGTNGQGYARGTAANDKRVVVGYTAPNRNSAATVMTRWNKAGDAQAIPTIGGGFGQAWAINDKGWVVGESETGVPLEARRAFLHRDGETFNLGTLANGDGSVAYGLNPKGNVVVGSSLISPFRAAGTHAFTWKAGRLRDLGTLNGLDSAALDVNDAEVVVGWSLVKRPGSTVEDQHGFVHLGGQMLDLNDLLVQGPVPYLVYSAAAVNAAGQIAAYGVQLNPDGSSSVNKALLLTPVQG